MKKETLDKLGQRPLCCGIHETLVSRLLAEREKLLTALQHAVEAVDEGWPHPKAPDLWREAVSFAEEDPTHG